MSKRRHRHLNRGCKGNPTVLPPSRPRRPAPVKTLADMSETERMEMQRLYAPRPPTDGSKE